MEITKTQFEWVYSPVDAIKDSFQIVVNFGEIVFFDGRIIATITLDKNETKDVNVDYLDGQVRSAINAFSLIEHIPIELDGPSRTETRSDGTKHHYLHVHNLLHLNTIHSPELIVYDQNGSKISGTTADRETRVKWFAQAIDEYRGTDIPLQKMLDSYFASMKDPVNEFIYLYEIRDTLKSIFGCKNRAVKELGITHQEWDELGKLANNLPLVEGGNRGRINETSELRKASEEELVEGRRIAVLLIEKYLLYLKPKKYEGDSEDARFKFF